MFLELVLHAVALDLGWIVDLVLNNLGWVFMFLVLGYGLFKKPFMGGTIIFLYLGATTDLAGILGWTFRSGAFFVPLFVAFIGSLVLQSFFGKYHWFRNYKYTISIIFYLALVAANIFMVG